MLYEMLAGRRAFAGASSADVLSAILREDPPEIGGIAMPLDRLVRHCLEKAPEARTHSAHDLGFDLGTLSGAGAVAALGLGAFLAGRLTAPRATGPASSLQASLRVYQR